MANIVSDWDPLDLAYAAGIIDGEGTIGITEVRPTESRRRGGSRVRVSPYHRIYVAVTMTDPSVPSWLYATFGGSIQRLRQRNAAHKPTTRWSCTSVGAARVCDLLLPYLKVKATQAELVSRFQHERLVLARANNHGLPDDELAARRAAMGVVRNLNRRGIAREA